MAIPKNKWLTKKPKFNEECIVLTAVKIGDEWDYEVYQIKKVDGNDENGNECWYWGWLTGGGEEYGDLDDLAAQKYFVIKPLNK